MLKIADLTETKELDREVMSEVIGGFWFSYATTSTGSAGYGDADDDPFTSGSSYSGGYLMAWG